MIHKHVLERPHPETATAADVIAAIEAIVAYDWTTAYSHGHIVIDDFNLEDEYIVACLYRPLLRKEWIEQQIKRNVYEPYVREMDSEITRFLRWLLKTPMSVRDGAMDELLGVDDEEDT